MCDRPTDGPTDGRTDGRTDGPTDGRTDIPSYRDARTHLKKDLSIIFAVDKILSVELVDELATKC